jgi:shikimate kinase
MGTGKTAVGRELSYILSMKLVDVDSEIEKSRGIKIDEIFRDLGEEQFRNIETGMIRQIISGSHLIISTGGGAVLREENMQALRENGIIFCLHAGPETILQRTARSAERPLLNVDDPMKKIIGLMARRKPFYEKAGIMIDTENKNPLQVAEEIAEIYNAEAEG